MQTIELIRMSHGQRGLAVCSCTSSACAAEDAHHKACTDTAIRVAAGCIYQVSCRHFVVEAIHKVHSSGVVALAIGPRVCATAGRDHRVRIWRMHFGALLLEVCWDNHDTAELQTPRSLVPCMTALWSAAGSSHSLGIIQEFHAMSQTAWLHTRASMRPENLRDALQVQHQEPVVALALAPAADLCAVCTADGATGIMDLQQESFHTVLRCHTSSIIGLAVHPIRCLLFVQ
jgi:WD40 repeat protein